VKALKIIAFFCVAFAASMVLLGAISLLLDFMWWAAGKIPSAGVAAIISVVWAVWFTLYAYRFNKTKP